MRNKLIIAGWFCYHEWVKPCKKVSECAGVEVEIYTGKWHNAGVLRVYASVFCGTRC